jgi:hypothetical protein
MLNEMPPILAKGVTMALTAADAKSAKPKDKPYKLTDE